MKTYKKYIKAAFLLGCLGTAVLSMNSCESDLTSLNVDPKHPNVVGSENLFVTGLYQSAYYIYSGSVNANNYRFFTQQWTETLYIQETNYNLVTRTQPRSHFNRMYVQVLNSYKQAQENLPKELVTDEDVRSNQWASIELASILVWENLVDTFGNVPYTDAMNVKGDVIAPKYDDAKSIYLDLIKRIDAAVAKINTSKAGYTAGGDAIYKGDMKKWVKFANSIKLRLAINLADADPATAKTVAEAAIAGGVMTADTDSYSFAFDGSIFTNPLFDDLVASGRNDFIPVDKMVDPMNTLKDPRRPKYFTALSDGSYKGGTYGTLNDYASYSHVNPSYTLGTAPAKLLSSTEVAFLKAEGAARGFAMGGTASDLYAQAIKASMIENGLTEADATAYLANNPFNAANWRQSIGYESYIAMWNNPFACWNFVRRLDYPVLIAPPASQVGGLVYRMPYSDQEYLVNKNNVSAAATAIGGDKATTKLFWDKN